ncbi:MAG: T9SS type A sorting domain-containing protein [Phaeodactylibacter xiamenensis]|uniref:T9SS type A sorting domain-containing protein n=1 Tax=Phaeodactylibacter xiamenensis TaxID=1524460 RepID=UPI00391CEDCC
MKKLIFLFFSVATSLLLIGQPTFHNIYDITNGFSENAFNMVVVQDGLYLNCGTWCSEDFKSCPILFKVNNNGDSLWHRQYDHNLADYSIWDYVIDPNEEYLYACGRIADEDQLPFIVKMNEWGDTLWLKTYYEPYWDVAFDIEQDHDGNLVVSINGGSFGEFGNWSVIKTDTAGQMLWSTTIEDTIDYTYYGRIAVLEDNSIMMANYFAPPLGEGKRAYSVAKLNADGEQEWWREYDVLENSSTHPSLIAAHPNGGVITGWAFDTLRQPGVHPDEGPFLRYLDADGEIIWEYRYLDYRSAEITNLTIAENGDIIMCGSAPSTSIGPDDAERAWLARVTSEGELLWRRYYRGLNLPTHTKPFNAVVETSDGGIAACTDIQDFSITPIPDPDVWLVKTDADGCITPGCQDSILYVSVEEIPDTGETALKEVFFKAYPNPARGPIQVEFLNAIRYEEPALRLFNLQGQQVLHQRLQRGAQSAELSTSGLPSGLYILQYSSAGQVLQQEKVVKVE